LVAGARKIYAGARDPKSITLEGVHAVRLDVTKPETISAAASKYTDVNLLIDNAGHCALDKLPRVDTDMAKDLTLPKLTPMDIARQALRALEAEQDEVLSVDWTRQVKAGLSAEPGIYLNYDPERSLAAAR